MNKQPGLGWEVSSDDFGDETAKPPPNGLAMIFVILLAGFMGALSDPVTNRTPIGPKIYGSNQ